MTRIRLLLPYWMNDANIAAMGQQRGWVFAEARPATNVAEEKIWTTADQSTFINYVADFGVQLHYLVFQGKDAERLASELQAELPTIDRQRVLQLASAAEGRDELIHAIYHAAIVAREDREDPELFAAFQKAFRHPDPDVRRAAVFASTYAAWRSFEAPLRQIAESDDSAEVRATAEATLESLRTHAWNAS